MARGITRRRFIGGSSALALAGCGDGRRTVRLRGAVMGTTWQAVIPDTTVEEGALAVRLAAALDEVDRNMSGWRAESEISRFNRSTSRNWFAVSADTAVVVRESLRIARLTGGAFDVTVAPAVEAWGFGAGEGALKLPREAELAALRHKVGFRGLEVMDGAVRRIRPGVEMDLSAIAKGFAADRMARLLEADGAADYLVEVGGELRCRGRNDSARPWSVAVERPVAGRRKPYGILHVPGGGLATSGDYRRFRLHDGASYAHIVDPRTLRPVSNRVASVTVHAETAMTADALATGLFVMGATAGMGLARRHDLAVLFLVRAGNGFRALASPEFQRRGLLAKEGQWRIS